MYPNKTLRDDRRIILRDMETALVNEYKEIKDKIIEINDELQILDLIDKLDIKLEK